MNTINIDELELEKAICKFNRQLMEIKRKIEANNSPSQNKKRAVNIYYYPN